MAYIERGEPFYFCRVLYCGMLSLVWKSVACFASNVLLGLVIRFVIGLSQVTEVHQLLFILLFICYCFFFLLCSFNFILLCCLFSASLPPHLPLPLSFPSHILLFLLTFFFSVLPQFPTSSSFTSSFFSLALPFIFSFLFLLLILNFHIFIMIAHCHHHFHHCLHL